MSTTNIFDTLAQHDTQNITHDQSIAVTPAAQPNIFDTLARHETELQTGQQPKGPTLSAPPTSADFHPEDMSSDPFTKAGLKMTTPFARKLIDAVDKLREVENFTPEGKKEHPIQAHLGDIANKVEGFLFGGSGHGENIGTGQYGMANNPVLAATMAAPGAAEAAGGVENAVREGISSLKGGGEGPGIIKQIVKGKSVAQEPAKAAVREIAGAEEETPLLEGHKTAIDEKLMQFQKEKQLAYKTQDEAAGFDVKQTRETLRDAEDKIKQPEISPATKKRLQGVIDESRKSLTDAEGKLKEAGIDPKAADVANSKWRAAQELRKGIVQHTSADGESVNVDGLLNYAKKLRNTKYGDRLEQIAGKEGADKFMADLQHAHDIGAHALKTQELTAKIAKWTGLGTIGLGGVHALLH